MTNKEKTDANRIFADNPKIDTLYLNPKGEFFTRKDFADASLGKNGRLKIITREGLGQTVKTTDTEQRSSISTLVKELEGVNELAVVEQLLLDEQNHQETRKGAVEVLGKKIEELKAAENGQS